MRRHSSLVARAASICRGILEYWAFPPTPIFLASSIVKVTVVVSSWPRRRPTMTHRAPVISWNLMSWPAARTMARIASADRAGRPLMMATLRSAVIGARPSSRPYRIAAATTAGLPRMASGTNSVWLILAARSPTAGSTLTHPSVSRFTMSDMRRLQCGQDVGGQPFGCP